MKIRDLYFFVAAFICFYYADGVHGQTKSYCLDRCIPTGNKKEITCGDLRPSAAYEFSLGRMGGINDLTEAHRKKGYKMCRFVVCCTDQKACEEHGAVSAKKEFLKEGMGAHDGEFPHQVFLKMKLPGGGVGGQCGVTIYNKHHIITANHCVRYKINKDNLNEKEKSVQADGITVIAGVTDLDKAKSENSYDVAEVIEHTDYLNAVEIEKGNDITVLRLKGDGLDFSNPNIRALRVASANFVPDYKRDAIFSGWGITEQDKTINYLLKATLPVHHPLMCQRIAGHEDKAFVINDQHLCAGGGDSGITVGQGDSGGGLVCPDENNRPVHCGIASYKVCKGKCVYPSVFTRVSNFTDNYLARALNNDESTLHNEFLGPQVVPEPVPEYLLQIFGPKKDCAAVLVRPQIALTSSSCVEDNDSTFRLINARTRREIEVHSWSTFPDYAEVKSENATRLLKDTVRKDDISYIFLNETVQISRYPEIGSPNWNRRRLAF